MSGTHLLVKMKPGAPQRSFGLAGGRTVSFRLEPLMPSIDAGGAAGAKGAAFAGSSPHSTWQKATIDGEEVPPWDLCYQLLASRNAFSPGGVDFAEPDLEHEWLWSPPLEQQKALIDACDWIQPPLGAPFARPSDPYWYLEKAQLRAAFESVPRATDPKKRVRIAHLDTGYDPTSATKPPHFDGTLWKGFDDTDDPANGASHGTFTLALLAGMENGKPLGAAANLDVFSLRIADGVVRFRTARLAQAFNYIYGLRSSATPVHVVTLSMGGAPSAAWAEAVNALYEAGIVVVAAAGNTVFDFPISTVFPARFRRVIAATGVMADGRPYADLGVIDVGKQLTGCYGPESKLSTSIAGCTPNVARARAGCPNTVDANGQGTSAATPQVASAAALWIQKNFDVWSAEKEGWKRVEMVRQALFDSAARDPIVEGEKNRLGRGGLRAADALKHKTVASRLKKEKEDSARFAILRVLFGRLGAAPDRRTEMMELEALQIANRSADVMRLASGLDLDEEAPEDGSSRQILEAISDAPGTSRALKEKIGSVLGRTVRADLRKPSTPVWTGRPRSPTPPPSSRPLRVYAFDPLLETSLDTVGITEATLEVPWEKELQPGPVGQYLEVVDIDPASAAAYPPVDLNQPELLAQRGHAPNEGNPQFHQQMVYAVAMKTIQHFERALGRVALWAPHFGELHGEKRWTFVRRLRIYPHALREANAYYDPTRSALLFGYFCAGENSGNNLPGGVVFTCLSHDIVAHETTHALLDGLHRFYQTPSNPDALAFHEAFSDIVALFQHFTVPEALKVELTKARGDLESARLLGGLAVQFGQAIGHRGALRHAIGAFDEKKRWVRHTPSASDYLESEEPHARGAVLVAAVFDAFLQIYKYRTEALVRLATQGTGVLPPGRIPHELVEQLASTAASTAAKVLQICIRALDYCPPVDITFGEYLRALVTADHDLVGEEGRAYRVAFVSAFRSRGIFPPGVRNLSPASLLWQKPTIAFTDLAEAIRELDLSWTQNSDRYEAYRSSKQNAGKLHNALTSPTFAVAEMNWLGLIKTKTVLEDYELEGRIGTVSRIEVHSVRPVRRVGPDGRFLTEVVIELTQSFTPKGSKEKERGGATLICSPESGEVRYVIRKRVGHKGRGEQQREFSKRRALHSIRGTYFAETRDTQPFAHMHRGL